MKIKVDSGAVIDVFTVKIEDDDYIRLPIVVTKDNLESSDDISRTTAMTLYYDDGTEMYVGDLNFSHYIVSNTGWVSYNFYQERGQRVSDLAKDMGIIQKESAQTTMALNLLVDEIIPSLDKGGK